MDTMSGADVARRLGTSIPRVKRAIRRLNLDVEETSSGRVAVDADQFERLAAELGRRASAPRFSSADTAVAAAIERSPLGAVSERAVARKAGVAPTTAARSLSKLIQAGLVSRSAEWVAMGRAQRLDVYRPVLTHPGWTDLAASTHTVRPRRQAGVAQRRVPPRLRHLFWNTASEQLDVERHGGYIARRLLTSGDLDGIAWGSVHLRPEDWRRAGNGRGLSPRQRALAENLARSLEP